MVWGEVVNQPLQKRNVLFPGVMEVLSEFYARKQDCVLTLSDDTIAHGIIQRYNSTTVDIALVATGEIVTVPVDTIVYVGKTNE